jgi:hypothetical protein
MIDKGHRDGKENKSMAYEIKILQEKYYYSIIKKCALSLTVGKR